MTTHHVTICRCDCPLHAGQHWSPADRRRGCTCAITCTRLPLVVVAHPWGCAIILDGNDMLTVPLSDTGPDWDNLHEIDTRSEYYDPGRQIAARMTDIDRILRRPIE